MPDVFGQFGAISISICNFGVHDEKKFYFGVSETPFKSVSEITKNNLIIPNTEIALNCPNTSGN